ncbi:protein-L-isoaspartate O-methyltransferase [Ruegeria pomeroyi]|uniref:Protein-L-isoaspartate O-methyltransferase n=1 Tax=Ruegeria alba TaxID=2916756 RepID=A0ABS9NVM6_9RHOB|nr:protein-L-isoaspartate O-methyltransferase [Ruegeria alba]MCE8513572.1 protein-L-isoaspartate O-methyltransferase [Ruegeria pomeroyi]MCE8521265.1 protein-L-isoaspartate O-methyltransferase [Ruegeria pomeroyi]MCE8525801.1 protein-L-isoaspartate O-methyltransferase [Ruegeria pomeroyi]MCE8529171.1 protein-L-isoaspartate O-methyltransferase [Ruegeria pomeroyi]MCE8533354.1 protein-L-isoaspartate O-methyltransferase [Ruegeria pomeroyi]
MTDFATRRRMMVDNQVRPSDVTKFPIIQAMLSVPREVFVPDAQRDVAYADTMVDLGEGRTMLEPRTLAKMLDAAAIGSDEVVMDVGSGLGYSAALAARMAELVVAVEEVTELAEEAQTLLMDSGADNAVLHQGVLAQGAAEHGPYDVILIQGGVEQVPDVLTDQLKEGGRIVAVFMEGALGTVRIGRKSASGLSWRQAFNATAPVLPGFERERAFSL